MYRSFMSLEEARIAAENGHDRNRFGCGDGKVVEIPSLRQSRSVGGNPIGALSLAQELSRAGREPLT
jgi:hypothetical protein